MVCSPYLQYCFIHVLHPSIRRKTVLESHFQHISIFRLGSPSLVSNQSASCGICAAHLLFTCGRYDVIKPLPPCLQIYPPRP